MESRSTRDDLLFLANFIRKHVKRVQRRLFRKLKKGIQWLDYNLYNFLLNGIVILSLAIAIPVVVTFSQDVHAEEMEETMQKYAIRHINDYMYYEEKKAESEEQSKVVRIEIKSETKEIGEHIVHTQGSMEEYEEKLDESIETVSSYEELPNISENSTKSETKTTQKETEPQTEPETEASTEAYEEKISSNQKACNAYADKLLKDGVITEDEANMLKARGNGPENPWIGNVSEDVIKNLADVMYAEAGCLISQEGAVKGKRALLLVGSVVLNRYHYPTLGDCDTLAEIIAFPKAYASRTKKRVGKRYYEIDGYGYVEDWARDLYTYGPIGPRNLVWQGPKQGTVYDVIHGEYFGLDKNSPF